MEKKIEVTIKDKIATIKFIDQDNFNALSRETAKKLLEVFENILMNTVKHNENSVIEVIIRISKEQREGLSYLKVEFIDNGIGIDPKYHDQIFTMFKRLHSREQYSGTGIGLAICKKIVQRHGGEIGVESKLGEGTTFWFIIPNISKEAGKDRGGECSDS